MKAYKRNKVFVYLIPTLIFLLILIFGLACGEGPKEVIENAKREIKEETAETPKEASEEIIYAGERYVAYETIKEIKEKNEGIYKVGQSIEFQPYGEGEKLKIYILKYEFSDFFKTGYKKAYPEEGANFIWILIKSENIGENEETLPDSDDFYILHTDTLISSSYYPETESKPQYFSESVFPGVTREGWLLFVIPKNINTEEILITFRSNFTEFYYWELK